MTFLIITIGGTIFDSKQSDYSFFILNFVIFFGVQVGLTLAF